MVKKSKNYNLCVPNTYIHYLRKKMNVIGNIHEEYNITLEWSESV